MKGLIANIAYKGRQASSIRLRVERTYKRKKRLTNLMCKMLSSSLLKVSAHLDIILKEEFQT